MPEALRDEDVVNVLEPRVEPDPPPREETRHPSGSAVRRPRRHHRRKGQRRPEREDRGEDDCEREVPEELPCNPLRECDGDEDAEVRRRRRENRDRDFTGPLLRGLDRAIPHVAVAEDVLEHENRVVDEHSDRDREPERAHHVHRDVAGVHQDERRDDGRRHRERHDESDGYVLQEQEEHEPAEQDPLPHVGEDVPYGLFDEVRIVVRDDDVEPFGKELPDPVEFLSDLCAQRDDVAVRARDTLDEDRLAPPVCRVSPLFFGAVRDAGEVREPDRDAVFPVKADFAEQGRVADLPDDADGELAISLRDMPRGIIEVIDGQGPDDLAEGHAEMGEFRRIDVYVDLALPAAENVGFREPLELREATLDLVFDDVVGKFRRQVGRHRDRDERFRVDVDLLGHRFLRVLRKLRGDGLHAIRHIEDRLRNGDVVLELGDDERGPLDGVALDLLDAFDLRDGILDRLAHERFDLRRAGPLVNGAHDDDRDIDLRNERDSEAQIAVNTDDHGEQDRHGRKDRTPDEHSQDSHVADPPTSFSPNRRRSGRYRPRFRGSRPSRRRRRC